MSKKMMRIAAIYAAAAIVALGAYAFVSHRALTDYRYAVKYSSQHSVEESVTAVRDLSAALKKSVYAVDGSMCGKICAQCYADAQAAQAAMSALPFSTQELERISGFLGVTGDYAYSLCCTAAEDGFTEEQVKTLSKLSDTAGTLADSLAQLQSDLNDKLVEIDSLETVLQNVGVEDTEKLSGRMLDYEGDFPAMQELSYDGKYAKQDKAPSGSLTDTQKLAAAADFAGVGLGELKNEYDYKGEGGRRCYSAGETVICVSDRGVESMSQSRLVSEENISEEQAKETAARFINSHGYDSVELDGYTKRGALAVMDFVRVHDGARCVDERLRISVALDDGSVYAFNAEDYDGGEIEAAWTVTQQQAEEKLPQGLTLTDTEKVIIRSEGGALRPCYLLSCAQGDAAVKIYVDADTGRQCRIEL